MPKTTGPTDRILTNLRKIQLAQGNPYLAFALPSYLRRVAAAALYVCTPDEPKK